MKKAILALCALLALALVFTGCEPAGTLGINGTYIARSNSDPAFDVLKIIITDETAVFYTPTATYTNKVAGYAAAKLLGKQPEIPASDWMTTGVSYDVSINGLTVTFSKLGVDIPATLSHNRREISFTYEGASITCKR